MTIARNKQIKKQQNFHVHVINRVMRKAFLFGEDEMGNNFDHRRQWVVDRIDFLVKSFAIEVSAYAVMSNHYHLVLYVNYEQSLTWDAKEVVQRWWKIFPPKMMKEETSDDIIAFHLDRLAADEEQVAIWRARLADLAWFMKSLNEPIARMVNQEDGCTGRFWEGRYKSQLLLDGAALMACMAYVDLNPIRAKMADTPEQSDYTSIASRIAERHHEKSALKPELIEPVKKTQLMPFATCQQEILKKMIQDTDSPCLPIQRDDYFKLVEWTGRCIKEGKKGRIPSHLAPILQRLEINEAQWVDGVEHYGSRFYSVVGVLRRVMDETIEQGVCWFRGQKAARLLFK